MQELLKIRDLNIDIYTDKGHMPLLQDIDLDIKELEIVALAGGSGGGKTTIGLSIIQLLPMAMRIKKGNIFFCGRDLHKQSSKDMRHIRGKEIGMVFQEPLSAFNPVFRVGKQIAEVLKYHTSLSQRQIQRKVQELLEAVEVPDPERVIKSYPHQLSGGLRQRAMIAQAIAVSPKLIIADEPTSNLDVTIQAKILKLFKRLKKDLGISLLLITHDLGIVEFLADRMFVLNKGRIIEQGMTQEVFAHPKEQFTKTLINVAKSHAPRV